MASLPRIIRAWQRVSTVPRPAPAAAQPSSEPEPETLPSAPTTQTLQPSEPKPPPSSPLREPARISSPAKKAASPAASPKYRATVISEASPPVKPARSPPVSPSRKSSDPRQSISPRSYNEPLKPATPPLTPLALPKSADVTTIQSRIQPKVEKSVEEPDRQVEYSSDKPPQKQLEEDVNLTGHNVGTVMEISQFSDKRSGGGVTRKMETETGVLHENEEGKMDATEKIQKATGFSMTPFMNSNFQEVNNSVMYNSSCTCRDPGLHLDFSGKENIHDGGEKSKY